jgi:HCO3- transporter family
MLCLCAVVYCSAFFFFFPTCATKHYSLRSLLVLISSFCIMTDHSLSLPYHNTLLLLTHYYTTTIYSDFGPVLVIMAMSVITQVSVLSSMGIEFLKVPTQFMLANGRSWFSPMLSIPVKLRLLCAIPATLLTSLFFLDQNISSRVVNSPKHNMKKPAAYHQVSSVYCIHIYDYTLHMNTLYLYRCGILYDVYCKCVHTMTL